MNIVQLPMLEIAISCYALLYIAIYCQGRMMLKGLQRPWVQVACAGWAQSGIKRKKNIKILKQRLNIIEKSMYFIKLKLSIRLNLFQFTLVNTKLKIIYVNNKLTMQ